MSNFKSKRRKIHLNKVCRSCLTEHGRLREITNTRIPMMMEYCTSVQVLDDDDMPAHICIRCFHQIAQFYTFKKKVERSDKILRNYIKQQKSKIKPGEMSDILDIAVNDAEIETRSEDEVVSEDDMPLIERVRQERRKLSRRNKQKQNVVVEEHCDDDNGNNKIDIDLNNALFLTSGPPPLVPLNKEKEPLKDAVVVRNLPENTPPLVPLKPLSTVNPKTILTALGDSLAVESDIKLKCSSCSEEFSTVSELKQHKLLTCQSTGLQCSICKKEFKERKRLIGHLKGHMVAKDYRCKVCGKCYPNPSTFKVHMRTHTGERPFKCQICSKGFVRWAGVVGHMKTHTSVKPYVCNTCGKGFKIQSNLERHKILHSGNLPFCCSYCGKTFSQSDNLQLHVRTYHTHERPFLCYECGKGFVSSTRLKRHMWVHTGYKPYLCKLCPKTYTNSNDLKNHERRHAGGANKADKPHKCPTCEMRFYHPCRLSKHMLTHERPYPCYQCTKTFRTESVLNKHITSEHSSTLLFVDEVDLPETAEEVFILGSS